MRKYYSIFELKDFVENISVPEHKKEGFYMLLSNLVSDFHL